MEHLRVEFGGRQRTAIIHDPGRTNLPVVILLHGSGGSGAWMLRETRWAEVEDFVLVAPDATRPDPDKRAGFYSNPPAWNDGSTHPPADSVSQVDDVAFIRHLIDEIAARPSSDPNSIFVTGFSNGAGMAFRLGWELADRIAAIAPVAGHLAVTGGRAARPMPTLYMVGTADPLIPILGGRVRTPWTEEVEKPSVHQTLSAWADMHGLPSVPFEERISPGLERWRWLDGLIHAWFIAGLGHHWPGGRGELNPRIAGTPSNYVDATQVIAEFFRSIASHANSRA